MGRTGLTRATVVETAARLVDEDGVVELTMAKLAKALGIALPSLYSHVRSLEHLRWEISLTVSLDLSRLMGEAIQGLSGRDAVFALARAYRAYVLRHVGRYAQAMLARPDPADERHHDAAMKCGQIVYGAVRGYGIADAETIGAARFLRAAVHGFASIEAQGGFSLSKDLDPAFEAFLLGVDRALSTWPTSKGRT